MSTNRRKFLKLGTLAAFATAMPVKALGAGLFRGGDDSSIDRNPEFPRNGLEDYSKAAFASCINSTFRLYAGHRTVSMKLVELVDLTPAGSVVRPGAECFSLRFRGANVSLPQGSYGIDHTVLGKFPLFLVPAGKDNGGQVFVAIVNRLSAGDDKQTAPKRSARLGEKGRPRAAGSVA